MVPGIPGLSRRGEIVGGRIVAFPEGYQIPCQKIFRMIRQFSLQNMKCTQVMVENDVSGSIGLQGALQ